MQSFSQKNQTASCQDLMGWRCNGMGHVTHMRLHNQRMQCDLEALQNLTLMSALHSFELVNAIGVEGSLFTTQWPATPHACVPCWVNSAKYCCNLCPWPMCQSTGLQRLSELVNCCTKALAA